MQRPRLSSFAFGSLALLVLGAGLLHARAPRAAGRTIEPPRRFALCPAVRADPHEALRRARLEQDLVRAEKTAVMLGELAAVQDVSE